LKNVKILGQFFILYLKKKLSQYDFISEKNGLKKSFIKGFINHTPKINISF